MMAHNKTSEPIGRIIRTIPSECLNPSLWRSLSYLVMDFVLAILVVAMIVKVESWWIAPILSFLLGTILTGIFIIGHDAGHRSFSKSTRINNIVGHLTTTLALWPFHVWRLSHDIHHKNTHNISKEIAWVPLTYERFQSFSKLKQRLYMLTRTWLFFIGSGFFTWYFIKDGRRGKKSKHFRQEDLGDIRFSLRLLYGWVILSSALSFYTLGIYGLVFLIVLPQISFQFWLSVFTYFHHTHDQIEFMSDQDWNMGKAQLECTVHVGFPRVVEFLCHDINWHVPHHVCVGIPHYRLRKAHKALKASYPKLVHEETMSLSLLRRVISKCHFIRSKNPPDMRWISRSEIATPEAELCTT